MHSLRRLVHVYEYVQGTPSIFVFSVLHRRGILSCHGEHRLHFTYVGRHVRVCQFVLKFRQTNARCQRGLGRRASPSPSVDQAANYRSDVVVYGKEQAHLRSRQQWQWTRHAPGITAQWREHERVRAVRRACECERAVRWIRVAGLPRQSECAAATDNHPTAKTPHGRRQSTVYRLRNASSGANAAF